MGTWALGFAAVLARTQEATPGVDAGKQMQVLAAESGSAAWLLVEEKLSPLPIGGQIKRAEKDQCNYSGWYLSAGQQQHWSSIAAFHPRQHPTRSLRSPASCWYQCHVAVRSFTPPMASGKFDTG